MPNAEASYGPSVTHWEFPSYFAYPYFILFFYFVQNTGALRSQTSSFLVWSFCCFPLYFQMGHEPIVYSRDQLFAFCSSVVLTQGKHGQWLTRLPYINTEGPGFKRWVGPRVFLYGIYMFSLCTRRFSPGAPGFSPPQSKNMRVSLFITVNCP